MEYFAGAPTLVEVTVGWERHRVTREPGLHRLVVAVADVVQEARISSAAPLCVTSLRLGRVRLGPGG